MHTETIEIDVFDKGDYVRTPCGVGIVVDVDKSNITNIEVMIQHKFGDEDNVNNQPKIMDNSTPFLITKEEYNAES